jgi:predicted PilT family ATPase
MGGQTAAPSERVILHLQNRMVGAIIGRSGSYIRQVMEQSGAHIRINSDPADESGDDAIRQCIISGKPEAQFQAQQMIYKKLQEQEGITQGTTRAPAIPFSIEVEMPEACIGRLIGKGGARIRQISDVSNAQLTVGVHCAHRGGGQDWAGVNLIVWHCPRYPRGKRHPFHKTPPTLVPSHK